MGVSGFLSRINQHQFGIFERRDGELGLVADRNAVAGIDVDAVDLDLAGGRYKIKVTRLARRIVRALAGLQGGGEHARVRTDRQCGLIVGKSARDRDEVAGAVRFRKGLGTPGRLTAFRGWLNPDLEDFGRPRLEIVFGVANAGTGAHDLDVAGFRAPSVAKAILVGDGAFPHIGDDFHIGVGMGGKAGIRRNFVVVPDAKGAEAHIAGVVMTSEREVVLGLEPAMVGGGKLVEGPKVDHENVLLENRLTHWISITGSCINRNNRNILFLKL
jgi:hypothetical protein